MREDKDLERRKKKQPEVVTTNSQIKIWAKVAANSFGGPAGQVAVIHKVIVEDHKLVSEKDFLHALNFCMLLPGPEAQQLATYLGWKIGGTRGGVIAGGLFILPGFLSILALSYLYVLYNSSTLVQGFFYGTKPAIIAVVIASLLKLSKKSMNDSFSFALCFFAFISLFFFNISFPIVIITAALLGIVHGKIYSKEHKSEINNISRPNFKAVTLTASFWLVIWLTPILLIFFFFGGESTFHKLNIFFSQMAMVTFGGAYAALTYVAQRAVENYAWLTGFQMIDGLAMAEVTPGPLIQSVQFVGFMAAFNHPDINNPLLAATIASILTTWVTFAPSFLWINTFAPYVEYIRGKKVFNHALNAISASVVGVILNLSIWFSLRTLFLETKAYSGSSFFKFDYPVLSTIDPSPLAICIIAIILQFAFKRSLYFILATSIMLGSIITFYNNSLS